MAAPLLDDPVGVWRQAEASDPEVSPRRVEEPCGNASLRAAVESLRTAANAQDARAAARSRMRDHQQFMQAGRAAEAAEAASGAEALSRPKQTPDVELALAARAASRGHDREAERRYHGVLNSSGDATTMGAMAAYRLAHLSLGKGARDEAIALLRRALAGADENLRAHVLVELADCLRGRVAAAEVEELYNQAVATDHPDLAPRAALTLGGLREAAGDRDGALALYMAAVASEHPDHAPDAEARHAALLRRGTVSAVKHLVLSREQALPGERLGSEAPVPRRQCGSARADPLAWVVHLHVAAEVECRWPCEPPNFVLRDIVQDAYTPGVPERLGSRSEPLRGEGRVDAVPCELVERGNNHLLVSHLTYVLAILRTQEALHTGEFLSPYGERWSDVLDARHPGLLAWRAIYEAPAECRCDGVICRDAGAQC